MLVFYFLFIREYCLLEVLYLIHVWQIHLLFYWYVCHYFYAYCEGEYYYPFVTVGAVGKRAMCGVCNGRCCR